MVEEPCVAFSSGLVLVLKKESIKETYLCRVLIRECLCAHRARAELAARPVEAVLAL